jgi:hypothetical protein
VPAQLLSPSLTAACSSPANSACTRTATCSPASVAYTNRSTQQLRLRLHPYRSTQPPQHMQQATSFACTPAAACRSAASIARTNRSKQPVSSLLRQHPRYSVSSLLRLHPTAQGASTFACTQHRPRHPLQHAAALPQSAAPTPQHAEPRPLSPTPTAARSSFAPTAACNHRSMQQAASFACTSHRSKQQAVSFACTPTTAASS